MKTESTVKARPSMPAAKSWLWPNHNIGKRESARLRDEHNATVNLCHELHGALTEIFNECALVHKHWGENCNQKQADEAIAKARTVLASAVKEGQ